MNRSYTDQQRRRALEVYKRTQSVTKTARELGYTGKWTLYKWLRERQLRLTYLSYCRAPCTR